MDWNSLQKQAAPYTSLVSITDPVSGLVDITYYGLKTTLSDVIKNAPSGGFHSVSIFADSLVIDVDSIATAGLLLVVRTIDVAGLNNDGLTLTAAAEQNIAVQILVGTATGGTFSLSISGQQNSTVTPPLANGPFNLSTYIGTKDAGFTLLPSSGISGVMDLMNSSWMTNSSYASFTAGAWLMDNSTKEDATTAQAMLAWVVACTASVASDGDMRSDYSQLYNQAAALLVTLNVADGATFVPILSDTYYSQHTKDIITVIKDYESKMATLDTETDIAQAIANVSSTMESTASIEVTPLQVQLDSISNNINSLFSDISDLRQEFSLQSQRAHTSFDVMIDEIKRADIIQTLKDALDMTMSAISLGFDAVKIFEGDAGAIKDAIEDGIKSIEGLVNTIESGMGSEGGEDYSKEAIDLLNSQMEIMRVVLDANLLYKQALASESGSVLPSNLSAITIDPVTDWDNYMITAEAEIANIKLEIPSAPSAQGAANNYLASLKILAGYGKAIGGKFVAYVSQMVEATIILAQIKAAEDVQKRWEEAKQNATSDIEKLAALKALVLGRLQAIKRSLYVAWTYYADSYFYLNFQSPPKVLHLDMSAAEIEDALVGVSEWVAQSIGNSPDGQHVVLPSDNVSIEFDFLILQAENTLADDNADVAILTKEDDGSSTLAFTIPIGTDQLKDVLPNNGNVAIWIEACSFFFEGITPNSKGRVLASVSTSGTYQNGFGLANAYTFVTKGLIGDYGYKTNNNSVYINWDIDTAVYMTPTPYTQWNIQFAKGEGGDPSTATKLTVQMTVAYKKS